jgi:hypothetical protein
MNENGSVEAVRKSANQGWQCTEARALGLDVHKHLIDTWVVLGGFAIGR